ncbi:MAG: aminotransferase [Gemmatimonadetes bacterium]|nr:MAG: aminotransferase [Gemmatimonadota bacterium]
MMSLSRRQLLASLAGAAAATVARPFPLGALASTASRSRPLRNALGNVDWMAVRDLFPLAKDWTHLSSFLFVSHPNPVAESIDYFRRKLDSDATWFEIAAFSDSEGKPFAAVKKAIAGYIGAVPEEIAYTCNTTGGLAMAYHGLRIRPNDRSGCGVRRIALYDTAASASVDQIVERVARNIRPNTRAVGVTWVHSSTGVKIPIEDIAQAVARANRGRDSADRCILIVDGVHGFANQDVDVARLGADLFAAGTHKWLFAPRGTGFLWGKRDVWQELRPTIPTFDTEGGMAVWDAWMDKQPLPPMRAAFVSPGGFIAYEHLLAIPAAVELHRTIGRDKIAAGISCFEVAGLTPDQVVKRLAEKKIRATTSPYKVSYARVSAGIMNLPAEIDLVLRELRTLT